MTPMPKLTIAYFYHDLLNLYGDTGNVEILVWRAKNRDYPVEVINISTDTKITSELASKIDLIFMGGGPDAGQKSMYEDLKNDKAPFLKDFAESGKPGLFICGSYQLLGHYYKAADGSVLEGLGIFDMYTQHFGNDKPRCIGNTVAEINATLLDDPTFDAVNRIDKNIVGFENHGGRTYLGKNVLPLAKISKGFGNNAEDLTEGAIYKSSIGSYFHGPLLARNPHIADFLIAKALNLSQDEIFNFYNIDDTLINSAHTASYKLKQ